MRIPRDKRGLKFYLLLMLLLLSIPRQAFAYLDAGTGSYFIQMLIAVVCGGILALKIWWKKCAAFFRGLFTKENRHE